MGHNSVVSGHPKSTGISWVDGLSTGPPYLGSQNKCETPENLRFCIKGKIVFRLKNRIVSRFRMRKRTSPLKSSREI